MTYYLRQGSVFSIAENTDVEITTELPTNTYEIGYNEFADKYFLTISKEFKLPPKIYGNTPKKADRILNTFKERPLATGIHLTGLKGSGKSLLSKHLSVQALKQNIPTLIVGQAYCGNSFNKFIQSIETPAIVLFDEFEKTYHKENQQKLLTLFDGNYPSKKLYVLTSNDKYSVDQFMINRPGRIYYNLEYKSLEEGFVRDYCSDVLNNKKFVEEVVNYSQAYGGFNFDMMSAIVEEMNRYDEPLKEVLQFLNINPLDSDNLSVDIYLEGLGKKVCIKTNYEDFNVNEFRWAVTNKDLMGNKKLDTKTVTNNIYDLDDRDDEYDDVELVEKEEVGVKEVRLTFTQDDIESFDKNNKTYIFKRNVQGNDYRLYVERSKTNPLDQILKLVM